MNHRRSAYPAPNYRAALLVQFGRLFPDVRLGEIDVNIDFLPGDTHPNGATRSANWKLRFSFRGQSVAYTAFAEDIDEGVEDTLYLDSDQPADPDIVRTLVGEWLKASNSPILSTR